MFVASSAASLGSRSTSNSISAQPPSIQAPNSALAALENCITRVKLVVKQVKSRIQNGQLSIPDHLSALNCPITQKFPKDAVLTNCGHLFDRDPIEKWRDQGHGCALCNAQLTQLTPIYAFRGLPKKRLPKDPILTCSNFKNLNQQFATKCLELAKMCIAEKNYREALDFYRKVLQRTNINLSEIYADIPQLYVQLGEPEKAILSRLHLSLYQIQEGKIQNAISTLDRCRSEDLKLDPLIVGLRLQLGQTHEIIAEALAFASHKDNPEEDKVFIYKQIIAHVPSKFEADIRLISLVKCFLEAYKQLIPLIKGCDEENDLRVKESDLTCQAQQLEANVRLQIKANVRSQIEANARLQLEPSVQLQREASDRLKQKLEANDRLKQQLEANVRLQQQLNVRLQQKVDVNVRLQQQLEATVSLKQQLEELVRLHKELEATVGLQQQVEVIIRLHKELEKNVRLHKELSLVSTVISIKQWASAQTIYLPPYPQKLKDFLAGDCTIWPGKKRSETHIVVPLFPKVVINGDPIPLTLESLNQLDKISGGPGCDYLGSKIPKNSSAESKFRYAVMTNNAIPGSMGATNFDLLALFPPGYEKPGVFDVARALLWENRRSGKRYFNDQSGINIRCKETVGSQSVIVGPFAFSGLVITISFNNLFTKDKVGVVGWREF